VVATAVLAGAVALILGSRAMLTPTAEADWDRTVQRILTGRVDGPIVTPVPLPQSPRRAGVYFGLMIAALFAVLYRQRRQRHVAYWSAAWVLLAITAYIISRGYATPEEGRAGAALLVVAKMGTALLLYRSAHSLAGTRPLLTKDWLLVPGVLLWLFAVEGRASPAAAIAPVYALSGLFSGRAAWIFATVFRGARHMGALFLAGTLGVVAVSNVGFGVFFGPVLRTPEAMLLFLASNSLAFLGAAFGMTLLVFEDVVTALRRSNEDLRRTQDALERLATEDALTGCYNRHFFDQQVGHEVQRHNRYGMPLSVLFADVDGLKSINDTYGHETGDRVLQHVGAFLRLHVRDADYVIRWGGDEFLILMTCPGAEAARKVSFLKAEFAEPKDVDLPKHISLSIGWAEVPPGTTDIMPFVHAADQGMYADKRTVGT
jgi:diguanylate cyclase (GGDEF)-like protein